MEGRDARNCIDPSLLPEEIGVAVWRLATRDDIDIAVSTARQDPDGWRSLSMDQRYRLLSGVAAELRKAPGRSDRCCCRQHR